MKKPKRTKTDMEKYHFQVRCLQRLGFLVDHDDLVKLIQKGKLRLHSRQSNRVTRWYWEHKGKRYILVYDKERKQIVTILFANNITECNKNDM